MQRPPPSSRVCLRDIARRVGVTHQAVSLALRNDPRVSASLRKRVQAVADEMGYRPDPMLTALSHYRRSKVRVPVSSELAWINHWPEPKRLRTYREFDAYWRGALEEAERSGYRLEEFVLGGELPAARLEKVLRARNIRGILIPPWHTRYPDWKEFHREDFCVVRFGHSITNPRAHLVTADQLTDSVLAFDSIRARGYQRIGLVALADAVRKRLRFLAGFMFAQSELEPGLRLPPLVLPEEQSTGNQQKLKAWLEKHRPEAVLTDHALVPGMLAQAGYRVPQDVAVAALSVLDGNADAGIDQNSEEIGRAAVQLLISLIHHNERGIPEVCRELLVEGRWQDGSTLPVRHPKS
jgi:LacI family transcriptional regulator